MSMMTAYYIDTMAKDHWQQMRSDPRSTEFTGTIKKPEPLRIAQRVKGLIATAQSRLHWNELPATPEDC